MATSPQIATFHGLKKLDQVLVERIGRYFLGGEVTSRFDRLQ